MMVRQFQLSLLDNLVRLPPLVFATRIMVVKLGVTLRLLPGTTLTSTTSIALVTVVKNGVVK